MSLLYKISRVFKREVGELFSHRFSHPGFFYTSLFIAFAISFGVFAYGTWARPPQYFPIHSFVHIPEGATLDKVSNIFKDNSIIRSTRTFTSFALIFGDEAQVKAGDYFLHDPESAFKLAQRIMDGDYGIKPEKLIIPEGADVYDIADLLSSRYASVDPIDFLVRAQKYEGYLFPDTYYVYPNITAAEAVELLRLNFEKKIFDIAPQIEAFGTPLDEIIILASIVEREASKPADRRKIASVLWNRLDQNMALQVDVTFRYINGKHTYNLTTADLLEENPYNTYMRKGLPPTPIANPSLDSILAVLEPDETPYLFFLADRKGNTYFSETYEEHLRKKRIYVD